MSQSLVYVRSVMGEAAAYSMDGAVYNTFVMMDCGRPRMDPNASMPRQFNTKPVQLLLLCCLCAVAHSAFAAVACVVQPLSACTLYLSQAGCPSMLLRSFCTATLLRALLSCTCVPARSRPAFLLARSRQLRISLYRTCVSRIKHTKRLHLIDAHDRAEPEARSFKLHTSHRNCSFLVN